MHVSIHILGSVSPGNLTVIHVTLNACILIRAINYKLIRDLCAAINRFCKSLEVVDVW
jgi:hypothetical protein